MSLDTSSLSHLDKATAAALLSIASAITKAQEQEGDCLEIRTTKRRETIAPANAFSLCFHGSLAQIMDKANLSRPALRLLFELIDISALGNLISINQNGLATRIGVSPNSVSRSMKALVEAGIVLELPHGLFLNPQLISKQGLASVAKLYPQKVAAGIVALQARGMEPNWSPSIAKTKLVTASAQPVPTPALVAIAETDAIQTEQERQAHIREVLGA